MNWLMIPRLFELDLKSGSSLARVGQTGMNAILQEALMGTAHIQHAAIIRRKDAVIRAKSTLFNVRFYLSLTSNLSRLDSTGGISANRIRI